MKFRVMVKAIVVYATFNKSSVILCWSELLTEESTNLIQATDKLYI